ncbi:LysM peptidoglycan-binding domain-containing protein [Aestuariibaculum marinum]|uniref:LysM peptidoglycan-binding domain-containing protein n=1 Tax=Aestuariibaculum marinum TaxID=2683592 RepID=A0A8J6PYE7_9FLAO|nr:LysM peptidoglycan-binding domain-containing protein [Aestuariibaculum marinum]MBD0822572.1 LysM peptidoglycan-binding domain-containing protein [Aestuariibaculum marinum]
MTAKEKYQPVLDLGETLNVKDGKVEEKENKLNVWGTTKTQYEKNLLWDKIKEIGGNNPEDIMADIKVEDTSVYARHTVKSGETLGKIAKHYYKDASKYQAIFNANTDKLKNPDLIYPDQELVIPNL